MRTLSFICVLVLVCLPLTAAHGDSYSHAMDQAREPAALTNADVIRLAGSGLSESIVVSSVRLAKRTSFDTSPEALIKLKAAKVSDAVIEAMLERSSPPPIPAVHARERPAAPRPTPESAGSGSPAPIHFPREVGVYVLLQGQFREVDPEIVNWRTGGLLKRMATAGLSGVHINGAIAQPRSRLQLSPPVEFAFVTPEGTSVTEYQLLRLHEKETRREFRLLSSGIVGARSGSEGNLVPFESEKVAARTYHVRIPQPSAAEYGFLPPGMTGASMTAVGKIYTFSIR